MESVMARKTKQETLETHTALLDAAERVFFEKGVSATTLTDVASAAGMTRGAIYWHFKDKSELLSAVFDRVMSPMQTLLGELVGSTGNDPLAALRQLTVHTLTQLAHNPRQQVVFNILFHRSEKTGELAELFANEMNQRDECLPMVEGVLKQAVAKKQLAADTDTWLAMQTLNAFITGIMHEWLLEPGSYDLAQRAGEMVDVFIAGLKAKPPLKRPHTPRP
jgi:TetR/AcrR family acrAB operon transcriptional repressor